MRLESSLGTPASDLIPDLPGGPASPEPPYSEFPSEPIESIPTPPSTPPAYAAEPQPMSPPPPPVPPSMPLESEVALPAEGTPQNLDDAPPLPEWAQPGRDDTPPQPEWARGSADSSYAAIPDTPDSYGTTMPFESSARPLNTSVVGRRVAAYLVDSFILSILSGAVVFLGGLLFATSVQDEFATISTAANSSAEVSAANTNIVGQMFSAYAGIILAVTILSLLYFAVLDWRGGTPGKRLLGIKVVAADGSPLDIGRTLVRTIAHVVDQVFYIGAFLMLLTSDHRRIGDMVGGTLVVRR